MFVIINIYNNLYRKLKIKSYLIHKELFLFNKKYLMLYILENNELLKVLFLMKNLFLMISMN
jgi:hypothetical protein